MEIASTLKDCLRACIIAQNDPYYAISREQFRTAFFWLKNYNFVIDYQRTRERSYLHFKEDNYNTRHFQFKHPEVSECYIDLYSNTYVIYLNLIKSNLDYFTLIQFMYIYDI